MKQLKITLYLSEYLRLTVDIFMYQNNFSSRKKETWPVFTFKIQTHLYLLI